MVDLNRIALVTGLITSVCISLATFLVVLVTCQSLFEGRNVRGSPSGSIERKSTLLVLLVAVWNFAMGLIGLALRGQDESNTTACANLASLTPPMYTLSNIFMYWFLLLRASLLKDEQSSVEALARRAIFFALLFAPAFSAWFYAETGFIVIEATGTCILQMRSHLPVAVFTPVDAMVSLALMYLFWAPLQRHCGATATSSVPKPGCTATTTKSSNLKRVARRNLKMTAIAVAATAVNTTVFSVMAAKFDADMLFWQILGVLSLTAVDMDLFVNLVCILFICSAWKPRWLATRVSKVAQRQSTVTPSIAVATSMAAT